MCPPSSTSATCQGSSPCTWRGPSGLSWNGHYHVYKQTVLQEYTPTEFATHASTLVAPVAIVRSHHARWTSCFAKYDSLLHTCGGGEGRSTDHGVGTVGLEGGGLPFVLVSSNFEYLKKRPITRVAMALYFNRVPKRVVTSLVRGSRLATFSPQGFNLDTSRNRSEPDAKDAQGQNGRHSGFI